MNPEIDHSVCRSVMDTVQKRGLSTTLTFHQGSNVPGILRLQHINLMNFPYVAYDTGKVTIEACAQITKYLVLLVRYIPHTDRPVYFIYNHLWKESI